MRTSTEDGTELLTLSVALWLARHTPIPAWAPAREEWAMVDAPDLRWTVCGTFGTILSWRERRRELHGTHLAPKQAAEIVEYCERFVRENPDTPIIPRTEVAYRRNSYSTTKTYLFTYNHLKGIHDDHVRQYDTAGGAGDAGAHQQQGAPASRGQRPSRNAQRQGARHVAVPVEESTLALFDEEGGGDRD